jgi:hypothetical protein
MEVDWPNVEVTEPMRTQLLDRGPGNVIVQTHESGPADDPECSVTIRQETEYMPSPHKILMRFDELGRSTP